MSTKNSTILPRRIAVVVVAIAALLFVPPVVRATSTIKSSAPLRLNRGFETPPSKADVVTSLERVVEPESAHAIQPPRATRLPLPPAPSLSFARSDDSPDPQRGPPAFTRR